jgi:magnesium chelatase family protein
MPGAFAKTLSYGIFGIDAYQVQVEIDIMIGQEDKTIFQIVGLPEGAVRESRERVRSAIQNSGFWFPSGRVTANLAPADIRKEGAAFDLALAIGVLTANGGVQPDKLGDYAFIGELGLNGELRPVRGALPLALGARESGMKGLIVPRKNAAEASIVKEVEVLPVDSLTDVIEFLNGKLVISPKSQSFPAGQPDDQPATGIPDLSDIRGQGGARRALEVAAAGGHNLLMIGPPGSGKTMLAKRLPGILPPLTLEESLETTKLYSIAGLTGGNSLITSRPYRNPHHTISHVAMVGGGTVPKPGEVSLAHHGVLFLDEMPEFPRHVLETLRQPLEDSHATVSRASMTCNFPANIMLCGSMNPCPCGFLTDPSRDCRCSPYEIQRYHSRLSGPLLDRIDIHIEVPAVKYQELTRGQPGEASMHVRERVINARDKQLERFHDQAGIFCNAQMSGSCIREYCRLDDDALDLLEKAMANMGLSARAYDRILKVARTIADLDLQQDITGTHVSEAIHYRSLDREFWRTYALHP